MMASRVAAVTLVLIVGLFAAVAVWRADRRPDHDALLQPAAPPSKATTLDVRQFAGSQACAECHADIATAHQTSGHAHTFHPTAEFDLAATFHGQSFVDPVRGAQFRYHIDEGGLSALLPETFGEDPFPLHYALGSGKHAVTFLSLIPHETGGTLGVEHRATYFRSLDGFNITPGQTDEPAARQPVEHFGKFVVGKDLARCVECHTTTGHIVDEQIVDLTPHVGCESCHGPGADHARRMQAETESSDESMSVTDRWPTARAEIDLCGRCHRLPDMLSETQLSRTSRGLVRLQSVGLLQSRCFLEAEEGLRCTTCHDPHAAPSTDPVSYEAVCRSCHAAGEASVCPQDAARGCIDCHMPGITLNHTLFHDHWIRVRGDGDPGSEEPAD